MAAYRPKNEFPWLKVLAPLAILFLIIMFKSGDAPRGAKTDFLKKKALVRSEREEIPPINPNLEGCADLQGDYKESPYGISWLSVRQPSCDTIIFDHHDFEGPRTFEMRKTATYPKDQWTVNRTFRWMGEKQTWLLEEFLNYAGEDYKCFGTQEYRKRGEDLFVNSEIKCQSKKGEGDRAREQIWVPRSRCLSHCEDASEVDSPSPETE